MKLKINTFQILLLLLFTLVKQAHTQELTPDELKQVDFSKPISFTKTEDRKYTFVFVDTQKQSIIKTFDIRQNNPFAKTGKKTSDPNYDVYEFEKKKIKDVFPNFNYEHYVNKEKLSDTISINQVSVGYNMGISENKRFSTVSYTVGSEIGVCRTLFIVFNSTGQEINRILVDGGTDQINITDDGTYLAYSYSGIDADGDKIINSGIKIININLNSVIVDKEINNLAGVSIYKNFIIAGTHGYYNQENIEVVKWIFFDISKNKIYTKELDVNCLGKSEVTDDGMIMRCIDGKSYNLSYYSDFEVEDLK